jgi:hypothetical protein
MKISLFSLNSRLVGSELERRSGPRASLGEQEMNDSFSEIAVTMSGRMSRCCSEFDQTFNHSRTAALGVTDGYPAGIFDCPFD